MSNETQSLCDCDLRNRQWNPNTGKCEFCRRWYKKPKAGLPTPEELNEWKRTLFVHTPGCITQTLFSKGNACDCGRGPLIEPFMRLFKSSEFWQEVAQEAQDDRDEALRKLAKVRLVAE